MTFDWVPPASMKLEAIEVLAQVDDPKDFGDAEADDGAVAVVTVGHGAE